MTTGKKRTRRPLSKAHETIAEIMYRERTRPHPGYPDGIPVSAIPKGICGSSTLDRIEAGTQPRVNPSTITDLMLRVYESDLDLIRKVAELAEATLEPNWFDAYRPKVAEWVWLYQYHEQRASHIQSHDSNYIPLLAQCMEYVDALYAHIEKQSASPNSTDAAASHKLHHERIRRWSETERRLTCLIGEAALMMNLGPEVAEAQTRHLMKLDAYDHVEIYVAPLAAGRYPVIGYEYSMLDFGDGSESMICTFGQSFSYVDPRSAAGTFYQTGFADGKRIAQRVTEYLNNA